jgi:imidazoleglycerol-phosphate dehydratase
MSRIGRVQRITTETRVDVTVDLDGGGEIAIETGVSFFDHMLHQLATHGRFDLQVQAQGDLAVDAHHTVEDVGIVLGQAFRAAVGDARGIARFASVHAPMDDALVLVALDISGRPYLHYGLTVDRMLLGTFATDLTEEFFRAFVSQGAVTLHIVQMHGRNAHHIIESAFKGLGVGLHRASRIIGDHIPSTKGVL